MSSVLVVYTDPSQYDPVAEDDSGLQLVTPYKRAVARKWWDHDGSGGGDPLYVEARELLPIISDALDNTRSDALSRDNAVSLRDALKAMPPDDLVLLVWET